jgi:hypothetical protein
MNEFNNRIAAQREILEVVNRDRSRKEELFGLSLKAIERWISVNRIDPDAELVVQLKTASGKLFFLANKSQEQVTEEYRIISQDVAAIRESIETMLKLDSEMR